LGTTTTTGGGLGNWDGTATTASFTNTATTTASSPLTGTSTSSVVTPVNLGASLTAITPANAATFLPPAELLAPFAPQGFTRPAKFSDVNQPQEVDFGVHNTGPLAATGVVITESFPAGTSFAGISFDPAPFLAAGVTGVSCLTPESTPPSTPGWVPGGPFTIICTVRGSIPVGGNVVIRAGIYFPPNFVTVPPTPSVTTKVDTASTSFQPTPALSKTSFTTGPGAPAGQPAPVPLPGTPAGAVGTAGPPSPNPGVTGGF
jgi:uncharacterized repeat protein (TIGR01451 family)